MSDHYPCHVHECPNKYHRTPGCRTLRERQERAESFGREKEAVQQSASRGIRPDVRRELRFAGADPARLERATKHRLYLVERMSPFNFHILGASGSDYLVSLTRHPECTCPDHTNRKTMCKHILFVLVRVLGLPEEIVLDEIARETIIRACNESMPGGMGMAAARVDGGGALGEENDEDGDILRTDEHQAVPPLNTSAPRPPPSADARVAPHGSPKPIDPEEDCPICIEPMCMEGEPLVFCANQCGKHVHEVCIQKAFNYTPTQKCPMCRATWRSGHTQR